jgi:predicted TIM-barrel fold metal-dependent hydrolase
MSDLDLDAPLVVVSTDSHVGPRLKEDLRQYCPKKYLDEYDRFVDSYDVRPEAYFEEWHKDREFDIGMQVAQEGIKRNATPGHHDVHERLKDMNRDGVAVEVIYHGSQNQQCFPFLPTMGGGFNAMFWSPIGSAHDLELAAVGAHMYNEYLADQCSVEPERHVGLAHLPMWDIDSAIHELEWASSAGLRGVNFPAPKFGIRAYDDLAWDRFWAACVDHGMTLNTHDGSGIDDLSVRRPHTHLVAILEGDLVRKMFPRLIFGGVFERFPGLKLVYAELQTPFSLWYTHTARRFDELWESNPRAVGELPRRPSEYLRENIFLGSSLLHQIPSEVAAAVRDGYSANVMWGADYPHQEGPYRHSQSDDEETTTRLGLRHAFRDAPPELATGMIGENAVRVFGLDHDRLTEVARRIRAVTLRQVATPIERIPSEWAVIASTQNIFPEVHKAAELLTA